MDQLLGVVYSNFAEEQKVKFRRLYLHKRAGLHYAFKALTGSRAHGIGFNDFIKLMLIYKPYKREHIVLLQKMYENYFTAKSE